jgi:hypothetical protein
MTFGFAVRFRGMCPARAILSRKNAACAVIIEATQIRCLVALQGTCVNRVVAKSGPG